MIVGPGPARTREQQGASPPLVCWLVLFGLSCAGKGPGRRDVEEEDLHDKSSHTPPRPGQHPHTGSTISTVSCIIEGLTVTASRGHIHSTTAHGLRGKYRSLRPEADSTTIRDESSNARPDVVLCRPTHITSTIFGRSVDDKSVEWTVLPETGNKENGDKEP